MSTEAGLRARRRRQTSADLRDAAIELVRSRGVDNVTIEQICARAGVSQRTFFNYFSNKELAIAAGPPTPPESFAEGFVAAGPAPYPTIFTDLVTLISGQMADAPGREHAAAMLEIARSTPAVQTAVLGSFESLERDLVGLVARRCGLRPADEVPMLIAAMTLTTIRTGMMRWAAAGADDPDDPLPYVHSAAAALTAMFAG